MQQCSKLESLTPSSSFNQTKKIYNTKHKYQNSQTNIPISRQIHQIPTIINPKMIDALRLPYKTTIQHQAKVFNYLSMKLINIEVKERKKLTRFLRRESQLLPPNKRIKKRRFPNIRPTNKRELRKIIRWTIFSPNTTLHELSLNNLSISCVFAENYVRAFQDPRSQRRVVDGDFGIWRNEEFVEREGDLRVVFFVGDMRGDRYWLCD